MLFKFNFKAGLALLAALTAIAVWQVTGDGQATEFEGAALIATYVILAALTLYE